MRLNVGTTLSVSLDIWTSTEQVFALADAVLSTRLWRMVASSSPGTRCLLLLQERDVLPFRLTDVSPARFKMHDRSRWFHKRQQTIVSTDSTNERPFSSADLATGQSGWVGQITVGSNMRRTSKERHRIRAFGISPAVPSPECKPFFISDSPFFHSMEANGQDGGIPGIHQEDERWTSPPPLPPHAHEMSLDVACGCTVLKTSMRVNNHLRLRGLPLWSLQYQKRLSFGSTTLPAARDGLKLGANHKPATSAPKYTPKASPDNASARETRPCGSFPVSAINISGSWWKFWE